MDALRQWWFKFHQYLDSLKSAIANKVGRTAYLIRGKSIPGLQDLTVPDIRRQYKQQRLDQFHCNQAEKERSTFMEALASGLLSDEQVKEMLATGEMPKGGVPTPEPGL